MYRPMIVATGFSRGIGRALREELRKKGYSFLLIGRTPDERKESEDDEFIWDLSEPPNELTKESLLRRVAQRKSIVTGFVHCAGTLGPIGGPANSSSIEHYWKEYQNAMAVNCLAGVFLAEALAPQLKGWQSRPPFVLHLSSGAALNPYAGWEAYCSSKAAILSHFRCLAARFTPEQLLVLSIAPGTVMTDMMESVLAANPEVFPSSSKFHALKESGGLVPPEQPAKNLCELLESGFEKLKPLHGKFFDFRKGVI